MKRVIVGVVLSGMIVGLLQVGLGYRASCAQETKPSPADDLFNQTGELYEKYVTGDLAQARDSLAKCIRLVENAQSVRPAGQASVLWLTFARLYVLEKKNGDDALAEAYLVKARYWFLREHELRGHAKEEVAERLKSTPPEKMQEIVENWDKRFTDGKGPNYARQK